MEPALTREICSIVGPAYAMPILWMTLLNLKQVLLARENDVESSSGLSSMLLYHATIIIHGQKSIPT